MALVGIEEWLLWTMFIVEMVGIALAALFGVLLVVLFLFTPAKIWLKAKRRGKPIIAARRRDRKIDFHLADKYEQGMVTSKKYGCFLVDADSVYSSTKGGVSILPVNAEIGITLSPRILAMIDGLKRMGFSNIVEAEQYNAQWGVCECGYEGLMLIEKDEKGEPVLVDGELSLKCPYGEVKDEESIEAEKEGSGSDTAGDAEPKIPSKQDT